MVYGYVNINIKMVKIWKNYYILTLLLFNPPVSDKFSNWSLVRAK